MKSLIFFGFFLTYSAFCAINNFSDLISIPKSDINITIAKKWFDHYYSSGKDDFYLAFEKGDNYKDSIELVLKRYEIPLDFYYLAMTESYFNNFAVSEKKAAGVWQFIPGTAKNYGLIISDQIDERLHPIKSTIAAARYIKDLYNIFQDWTLAAAAYNCGEYRLLHAIKKAQSRSFSVLANKKLLPDETINYVSKIWVTREIDQKIRLRGERKILDKYLNSSPIAIEGDGITLDSISIISEMPRESIVAYNPDLVQTKGALPKGILIYLPIENANHYADFIRYNGVISSLRFPASLKNYGFVNSKEGDKIKVTFISNQSIKLKNVRTSEETILNKKDLPRI